MPIFDEENPHCYYYLVLLRKKEKGFRRKKCLLFIECEGRRNNDWMENSREKKDSKINDANIAAQWTLEKRNRFFNKSSKLIYDIKLQYLSK